MQPEFIFMLTLDDRTVPDACERLAELGGARVPVVGFKDVGLPFDQLRNLADRIRATGRKTALEVVSLDAESELRSAAAALELGVDYLLGGTRAERVAPLLAGSGIGYYPFCGRIEGHPSRLCGSLSDIVDSAVRLTAMDGVDGVDLLAYRWDGDGAVLAAAVAAASPKPVIAAGSVDRPARIEALAHAGVAAFTVGTAAFLRRFPAADPGLRSQIDVILRINEEAGMEISRAMIEEAAGRIADRIRKTPVIDIGDIARSGSDVFLKLESLQHSGSFKARGAFNTLLSGETPEAGVIAASGGNHGAAVAYACQQLGLPVEIFIPEISSQVKQRRLRDYGAIVHVIPGTYVDALAASERRRAETGAASVHAYDLPAVVAGQGTVGREIAAQVEDVDTVFVAVGGAGLIGGVASWFRGDVKVIGVEPVSCRSLAAALEAGHPVDVDVSGLAADALGARRVGDIGYDAASHYVDRVITLEDSEIARAQVELWRSFRIAAEPGAAAAFAPLLTGAYSPAPGERVCVLICGGNADLSTLAAA
jgi:threonine dehydratase